MLSLYHAANAVCAAKVRLVLAEKALEYESRLLDFARAEQLAPEYLRINPEGVVPTLVHDGRILTESTVIAEYLDAAFPAHPLRPHDAYDRARSQLWTRREDTIHAVVNTLTTLAIFRPELLACTEAERAARYARLPDPARATKLAGLVAQGAGSPIVLDAMIRFARYLRDMQTALASAAWLGGAEFGLADAGVVSFFARIELLGLAALWQQRHPAIAPWLEKCKSRPSFETAIGGFIPPSVAEHYRQAGLVTAAAVLDVYNEALALI